MNRKEIEDNVGNDVSVIPHSTNMNFNNYVAGKVFQIIKLTKDGMAMLQFGNDKPISVSPFYVHLHEY